MAILFLEDWDKYPSAIVDTKTTNESFVRLAGLYKSMGITNHSFVLALHNPELLGVDPYDNNLTTLQLHAIVKECKENPWYFLREIARGPSIAGGAPNRFRANRGNIGLYWLFFNHVTTLLIQPRQTGKSFSTDILLRYLMNIKCKNTNMNLLTKDDGLRAKNIKRLKDIEKEWPDYLRLTTKKDANNTERITVNLLNNTYDGHVPQASPKAAANVGRGLTSPIFHVDEIAFVRNIQHTLSAALSAGGAARDAASLANAPYGTILTTTAGRLDSDEGKFVYRIYENGIPWTEHLMDSKNASVLMDVLSKQKGSDFPSIVVTMDINHRQLGYTDAWLKQKMSEALSEGDDAERDFLNKWNAGSAESPIDIKLLNKILDSEEKDYYSEVSDYGYITRWYIPEDKIPLLKDEPIVMGLDTSDAVGKDDIALVLRSLKTGSVIAVGQFNETNLDAFAEWLVTWFMRFNKMVSVIERRSSGVMIMDKLIRLLTAYDIDPFSRLFNWVVDESDLHPKRFEDISRGMKFRDELIYDKYRKEFGFATSGAGRSSRHALYGTSLLSSIKYTGDKVRDGKLIKQIAGLTVRNGRIDHKSGSKDDLVIAWMLSFWFMLNAKNIEFYNLETRNVLSKVVTGSAEVKDKEKEIQKRNEQLAIREAIDKLVEILKNEKSELRISILTSKLRKLSQYLDAEFSGGFRIENVLSEIEKNKKKNSRFGW